MKTLQTIQTLSKVGKILSKIIFVCCIVGVCISVVGLVSTALGVPSFKLGGITLESFLQEQAGLSQGTLCACMAAAAFLCAGEGVLSKFAVQYFERELADGTPFTLDGAKELLRLGVLSICVPTAANVAAQIVQKILAKALTDVQPADIGGTGGVGIGILLIILALVCKCGAQLLAEKAARDEARSAEMGDEQ